MKPDTNEWFNPWADKGLHLFDCYAKTEDDEDASLYCVAPSFADAVTQWVTYYEVTWPYCHVRSVDIRKLGLPHGAGAVEWSIASKEYEVGVRRFQKSAPCVYKRIQWVQA